MELSLWNIPSCWEFHHIGLEAKWMFSWMSASWGSWQTTVHSGSEEAAAEGLSQVVLEEGKSLALGTRLEQGCSCECLHGRSHFRYGEECRVMVWCFFLFFFSFFSYALLYQVWNLVIEMLMLLGQGLEQHGTWIL